jgi:hypothetical protein
MATLAGLAGEEALQTERFGLITADNVRGERQPSVRPLSFKRTKH